MKGGRIVPSAFSEKCRSPILCNRSHGPSVPAKKVKAIPERQDANCTQCEVRTSRRGGNPPAGREPQAESGAGVDMAGFMQLADAPFGLQDMHPANDFR